jgi:hypothetical protein
MSQENNQCERPKTALEEILNFLSRNIFSKKVYQYFIGTMIIIIGLGIAWGLVELARNIKITWSN